MKKEVQKKEYDKAFIYTVLRALWTEKLDYKAAEARYKVSYYTIIQWKRKFFEEREMILSTNLSSVIRSDDDDKDSQLKKL
jgi:transposase